MKKYLTIFGLTAMIFCALTSLSQVSIRRDSKASEQTKTVNTDQQTLQVIQPTATTQPVQTGQPAESAQYASTAANTKYYSIDPTAFSSSWGVYEIRKVQNEGAYLYAETNYGTAYLVAPLNLPHNARLTGMKVLFYDGSATQDLRAILWQGGPNFGGPDSYNLGQVQSLASGGFNSQACTLSARVDNENHSYYVAVSPSNNTQWPTGGELKIKRITIEYTEE